MGGGAPNETTILTTLKDTTADGIQKLRERLKGVQKDAEKIGQAVSSSMGVNALRGASAFTEGLNSAVKVITVGAVVVKGLEAGVRGLSAAFKYLSGDVRGARQEMLEFYDSVERTIRSLPGGGVFADTGFAFNDKMEEWGKKAGQYLGKGVKDGIREVVLGKDAKSYLSPAITAAVIPFAQGLALPPGAKTKAELRIDAANSAKAAAEDRARAERDLKAIDAAYSQFGSRFSLSEIDQQLVKLRNQREQLVQEMGTNAALRDSAGHATDAGAKFERSLFQLDKDIELLRQQRQHAAEQQKTLLDIERAKLVDDHAGDLAALNDLAEKQREERERYVNQFGGKGVEELDQRQALEKVNLQVAQAADRANAAESKLNETIAQNAHLLETASISVWEADRRNARAQKEYEAEIEKTRLALMDMLAVAKDPEVERAIQRKIDALPAHVSEVRKELNKLGGEVRDSLQQPMEGMFKGIITGTTSAKQAFKNMVAGFADNLASLAANKLATAILGGGGTGAGGGLGGLIGSFFTAKNSGGWIPGSGPDVDSVPAVLTPGEYVVRRRSAMASPNLLAAINAGHLTDRFLASTNVGRYNAGGFVQPTDSPAGSKGGSGGGVTVVPAFVMTPAEAKKFITSSKEAIFELLQQYPERIPRTA